MTEPLFRLGAVVNRDGILFECRPPTLSTVVTVETLYTAELVSAYLATHTELAAELMGERAPTPLSDEATVEDLVAMFASTDDRPGKVLETCVTLNGGEPGALVAAVAADKSLAIELATAVVGLVDVDRIIGALGLDTFLRSALGHRRSSAANSDGQSPWSSAVLGVARVYAVDPMVVANDWPFLAFIAAAEQIAAAGSSARPNAVSDDISTATFPGVGYTRAH